MGNTLRLKLFLVVPVLAAIAISGCSSLSAKTKARDVKIDHPITLEMSGALSHDEVLHYYFSSHKVAQKALERPELTDEKIDFVVKTTTQEVYPGGEINYLVQTLSRKGNVPLHDLAFPEPGEHFEEIVTRNGRILKAGDYPPDSIFFLPPVPLPFDEVKVGDTWTLKHEWASDASGLPLVLDMVTILKGVYACGKDDQCADLEISGQVSIPTKVPNLNLDSTIEGHMLFAIHYGSVVWSEIRTKEKVLSDQTTAEVVSCMKSQMNKPDGYAWKWDSKVECDPRTESADQVPGIASN